MIPRAFNTAGIEACRTVLGALRAGTSNSVPRALLEDDTLSAPAGPALRGTPPRGFKSRWELGVWLWQQMEERVADQTLLTSDGLWTWLAFALFDVVAPSVGGVRKIGEDARFVLDRSNRRRWYRHLLAGPYLLVRAHSDNPSRLRAVLAGATDTPGELYEQLAGRKEIVTSAAVVDVLSRLYWNAESSTLKRGARGRAGGSVNRYGILLNQFDVTYDLARISADRLLAMLPREFARYRG